ncbi:MAG: VCBS repeat-containing protein [Proteobacteria bacterium]|nr:VCBS repeat-containing protein [Pseudomonadota bacterium]
MTLLFALGCTACSQPDEIVGVTTELDGSSPVRVEVGSATGARSVTVPIRLVNGYGIAVPGDINTVTVSVAGSFLDKTTETLDLDGMGYGELAVSSDVEQAFTVTATGSGDNATSGPPGTSWITGGQPETLGMHPGWAIDLDPEFMVPAKGGMALSQDNVILWQTGKVNQTAQKVAELETAVLGLAGDDIDADGVPDVIAWTASEVVLLRGRANGGFTWGGGFEVPGMSIRGAAVSDANNDNLPDLAIAFGDGESGGFQLLHGDGVWGFTPDLPYELDADPWSIAMGQLGPDGEADVVLMLEGDGGLGVMRRFGRTDETWVQVSVNLGGTDLDDPLLPGSYFHPCADIDGGDSDELIAVGPPDWTNTRPLVFYTFENGTPKQYTLSYNGFRLHVGDVTGDGNGDLVLGEGDPQQIRVITSHHETSAAFMNRAVASVPTGGPVGTGDFTGDGLADIVVASEVLYMYPGTGEVPWDIEDDGFVTFGMNSYGEAETLVEDLDDDGWPEIITVRKPTDSNDSALRVYSLAQDEGGYQLLSNGSIDLEATSTVDVAEGLDMARCDDQLYLLTDDDGSWLWSIDLDLEAGGEPTERNHIAVDGAHRLDCGEFGDATVVAITPDGDWTSFDRGLSEIESGSVGSAAEDIVIADTEGLGSELFTCPQPDCSLVADDLDGDGLQEVVRGGTDPLAIGWQLEFAFEHGGDVSLMDVDGDDRLDIAFTDTELERVVVYRSLETAFAPALVFHARRDLDGPATMIDGDGDGIPELFFENGDGNLMRSGASSESEAE